MRWFKALYLSLCRRIHPESNEPRAAERKRLCLCEFRRANLLNYNFFPCIPAMYRMRCGGGANAIRSGADAPEESGGMKTGVLTSRVYSTKTLAPSRDFAVLRRLFASYLCARCRRGGNLDWNFALAHYNVLTCKGCLRAWCSLAGIVARLAWVRNGNGDKMRQSMVLALITLGRLFLRPRFAPGATHYMYMNGAHTRLRVVA